MSVADGWLGPAGAAAVLALGLLAGLANTAFHLVYHRVPLYLDPRGVVGDPAGRRPTLRQLALLGAAVAGVLAFAASPAGLGGPGPLALAVSLVAAPAALAAIWALRQHEVATYGPEVVVRLGKYAPASVCLLAWWFGAGAARVAGDDAVTAWARGWDVAAGAFGAAYVLAAIAKLREAGWAWARPEAMALLLAERGFGAMGPVRLALARSRAACAVVGAAGLGIELGALAFVWPPARPWAAATIVGFKAMTWGLFGYFEPEWVLAAVAVGVAVAG